MNSKTGDFLDGRPFAAIQKRGKNMVDFYWGNLEEVEGTQELEELVKDSAYGVVTMLPWSLIEERGISGVQKNPIQALRIDPEKSKRMRSDTILREYGPQKIHIEGVEPDIDFPTFRDEVFRPVMDGIQVGEYAQAVPAFGSTGGISSEGNLPMQMLSRALSTAGTPHMNFTFFDGVNVHTASTPERLLECDDEGIVRSDPIAGTRRKPTKSTQADIKATLMDLAKDKKEKEELSQLVSEVAKFLIKTCSGLGKLTGPSIIECGAVFHTLYNFVAKIDDKKLFFDLLRDLFPQPTVSGGPVNAALFVITEIERKCGIDRGYYGGGFGIIQPNYSADLALAIRYATADIENGTVKFMAGAGCVARSNAKFEYEEIAAKKYSMQKVLETPVSQKAPSTLDKFTGMDEVQEELDKRNTTSNQYYFRHYSENLEIPELKGKNILIIDFEDEFARIQAHMLRKAGAKVTRKMWYEIDAIEKDIDICVLGPGPGNINMELKSGMSDHEKNEYAKMQKAVAFAKLCLDNDIPTMGVCMGCQAIGKAIDNNSVQLQQEPTQGRAMLVDLINLNEPDLEGRGAILGFYNSWVVRLTSQLRRKVFATLNKFGDGIVSAVAKDGTFVMLQGHPDAFEAGGYQGAHLRRGGTLGGFEIQTDYLVYLAVQNKDTIDRGRDEDISIADYLKTNGSVKRKKSKRKSSGSRASKVAANGVVPKRYGRMAPIVSLPKKNPSTTTKSQIPGQLKLGLQ